MNEGRSGQYEIAAPWLGIAMRAHAASGRSDEWAVRLDALIEMHRRKHKLRPRWKRCGMRPVERRVPNRENPLR